VAQLYPQALGTHFSRLLLHEWFTVGLFFNSGHNTGIITYIPTCNSFVSITSANSDNVNVTFIDDT
jgi:hypothetical protein